MIPLLIIWGGGTLFTLAGGFLAWADFFDQGVSEDEAREYAREVLFCWAWPIMLGRFLVKVVRALISDAFNI